MEKILAKSDGTTLIQHSNDVSRVAVLIAKSLGDINPELIEAVRISGLLHDIGKCTSQFQKVLKNNTGDESSGKIKFLHNEVGWAFLVNHLKVKKQIKELREKLVSHIEESGEVDDKGNLILPFEKDIEGYTSVMKQRRVSRKIDAGVAEQLISEKNLEEELYKTVRIVDEDALMAALYEGKLTEEEVDEMYPQTIVWALVMNKR